MHAVDRAPLPARVADHGGVVALAGDRERRGVDGADHVEIDKAVVEGGDQRIRHGMGEPREIAVGARRIDDHEVVRPLDRADRFGKAHFCIARGTTLKLDENEAIEFAGFAEAVAVGRADRTTSSSSIRPAPTAI